MKKLVDKQGCAHVNADGVRDVHARPADATGARRAGRAAARAVRAAFERVSKNTESNYAKLFPKGMALERAFVKAGGMLIAGTDPTGSGGVIPGYSNQRQVELLVEAGFTPLEAIQIATLNGAKYLGSRAAYRLHCGGQAGRPGRVERKPGREHCRHQDCGDRVQAGCRIRSGQADRIGQRQSRPVLRVRTRVRRRAARACGSPEQRRRNDADVCEIVGGCARARGGGVYAGGAGRCGGSAGGGGSAVDRAAGVRAG